MHPPPSSSPLVAALRAYREAQASALTQARKRLGIGELDAKALLFVAEHAGTRPGDLKSYLNITSAGVTTLTDRLIERGVVRRDLDPDDRRAVRISTTVDLLAEPWSALTKFDNSVDDEVSRMSSLESELMATAIRGIVAAASSAD